MRRQVFEIDKIFAERDYLKRVTVGMSFFPSYTILLDVGAAIILNYSGTADYRDISISKSHALQSLPIHRHIKDSSSLRRLM